MFYLMRGASEESSRAFVCGESAPQGHAVWNELPSPDPDAALRFYSTVLGLRHEGGMPMGALGEYRFIHAGPDCIGALMPVMPNGAAGWLVYFSVDDIDRAASRLGEAGGRAIQGPDEIPGGAFSLVAEDGEDRLERRISREGMVSVGGNSYSVPDATRWRHADRGRREQ